MTVGHVIATGLLVLGVAVEIVAVVGVTAMRDVYDRLHYVGLAGFGALLVGASVLVREGFSLIGNKALLLAIFVLITAPVLSHVTARAARIRAFGDVVEPPHDQEAR